MNLSAMPLGGGAGGWSAGGAFTRVSNSTFTVADNATSQAAFTEGHAIRYRATAGTWRYGIVTGYAAGTVTLAGAPMTAANDDELQWSVRSRTIPEIISIPGRWADTLDAALLEHDLLMAGGLPWTHGPAYLVRFRARSLADDSGVNQPEVDCVVDGNYVGTAGIEVVDTGWTSSGVAINPLNYGVVHGSTIEVATDGGGSNDDSTDLNLELTFVLA